MSVEALRIAKVVAADVHVWGDLYEFRLNSRFEAALWRGEFETSMMQSSDLIRLSLMRVRAKG
jgi:hypothetical protein